MSDRPSHLTVSELWAYMVRIDREVSRDLIRRDVRSGRLPAIQIGRMYLIETPAAMEYAQAREPYESLRKTNPGR